MPRSPKPPRIKPAAAPAPIVLPDGTRKWRRDGRHHREDGPAIEYPDGTRMWWRDGQHHREDGPAIEWADGELMWYRDDRLHREDGPAIEHVDGTRSWCHNGQLHREDGPAIERANGTREWYHHDRRHREDGPAIEDANGRHGWYRHGVEAPLLLGALLSSGLPVENVAAQEGWVASWEAVVDALPLATQRSLYLRVLATPVHWATAEDPAASAAFRETLLRRLSRVAETVQARTTDPVVDRAAQSSATTATPRQGGVAPRRRRQ